MRKLIACLTAVFYFLASTYPAYADAIQDTALEAQIFGKSLIPDVQVKDSGTGDYTWIMGGGNTTINVNDVFPEAKTAPGSVSDFTSLYGDNTGLGVASAKAFNDLKTEETVTGNAFQTIFDGSDRSHPDLTNDPIWENGDAALTDVFNSDFTDCAVENNLNYVTETSKVHDYQICLRELNLDESCTFLNDVVGQGVIKFKGGNGVMKSCGGGCIELSFHEELGTDGSCQVFSYGVTVEVLKPEAIQSATLTSVGWDDYVQVTAGGTSIFGAPVPTGSCETGTRKWQSPNADATAAYKTKGDVTLAGTVSVQNGGFIAVTLQIRLDPSITVTPALTAQTDACQATLDCIQEGLCTVESASCAQMPALDANGCATFDGVQICESDLGQYAPPFNQVSPLCLSIQIGQKTPFEGQMDCWTDPQGVQHCPYNDGSIKNGCTELEANPQCGFISSKCVEGATGPTSGRCYVFEDTYDCGTVVEFENVLKADRYVCAGPVRCMGNDCITQESLMSTSFARAAAMLNTAETAAQDLSCSDGTCTVFEGKAYSCKKAVGGVVNCCKNNAAGIGIADYLTLLTTSYKVASTETWIGTANNPILKNPAYGAWETVSKGATTAFDTLMSPFTNAWEGVVGGTAEAATTQTASGALSSMYASAIQSSGEWVANTFGQQAANLIFDTVGEGSATQYLGMGTGLTVIMAAYTVYQITMILIKLIWQCEQSEFELSSKKQLGVCHYVGSYCASSFGFCLESKETYCCYNSPLSRILQEQVRGNLGMSFGTAKNPGCGGITLNQLNAVNWDTVDLSEWTAMLSLNGMNPEVATDKLSLENVTGNGNLLNTGQGRTNALERTQGYIGTTNMNNVRQSEANKLWGN